VAAERFSNPATESTTPPVHTEEMKEEGKEEVKEETIVEEGAISATAPKEEKTE
jgi:hypothetical protein